MTAGSPGLSDVDISQPPQGCEFPVRPPERAQTSSRVPRNRLWARAAPCLWDRTKDAREIIRRSVSVPAHHRRHPLGCVRCGTSVAPYNPRFAAQVRCTCHGGRSASGSDGTVSLRSRTTAVLRGFRGRLARPQETAPEGEDAGMGPATTLGSERD